jgi:hypothetical protein
MNNRQAISKTRAFKFCADLRSAAQCFIVIRIKTIYVTKGTLIVADPTELGWVMPVFHLLWFWFLFCMRNKRTYLMRLEPWCRCSLILMLRRVPWVSSLLLSSWWCPSLCSLHTWGCWAVSVILAVGCYGGRGGAGLSLLL